MEKWENKVAVVTGANSGIGEAIARTLVKHGMMVIGLDIKVDKLEDLAEDSKGKLYAIKCDIQDEKNIVEAFRMIENKFGGVDVLINNAAFCNNASIMEGSVEEWKKVFDTNTIGASICTKEALKTMRSRGDNGLIIFINSITGKISYGGQIKDLGMYPTSKCALNGLAHSLRIELKNAKSFIGITSLFLGLVHTNMANEAINRSSGLNNKYDSKSLPKGYLAPQDLADAVVNVLNLNSRVEIQELTLQCRGIGI